MFARHLAVLFALLFLLSAAAPAAPDAPNLARQATVVGSYDNPEGYQVAHAFDGNYQTRWAAGKGTSHWLELSWPRNVHFSTVTLYEWNHHLESARLQLPAEGGWMAAPATATVLRGNPDRSTWVLSLPHAVVAPKLRIELSGPAISLYEVRVADDRCDAVLSGRVHDAVNGAAVANARIRVLPTDEVVQADARGRFRLRVEPGRYTVEADEPLRPDGHGHDVVQSSVVAGRPVDLRLPRIHGKRIVLEGVLPRTKMDPKKTDTVEVPLDVPPGVTRMQLELQMWPADGSKRVGDAIEFFYKWGLWSLFEPPGIGPHTFRGTGMSRRSNSAFLGIDGASDGWIAGPIAPGRWTLLAWSGPDAVDMRYRFIVRCVQDPAKIGWSTNQTTSSQIVEWGPRWFKGDFHNHSTHSADADLSLAGTLRDRASGGWDFFALTDHNTVSGHRALLGRETPLVLLGEEVTTQFGHFNVYGIPQGWWADFRIQPGDDSLDKLIDAVHGVGGQISLNHPGYPIPIEKGGFDWNPKLDAAEVWNGLDDDPLEKRLAWADNYYRRGMHIVMRGGSDIHHPDSTKGPVTWVYADNLSRDALLRAMKAGHAFITRDSRGPQVELQASTDGGKTWSVMCGDTVQASNDLQWRVSIKGATWDTLRVVTDRGIVQQMRLASDQEVRDLEPGMASFVRLEVVAPQPPTHYLAITNPIYVRH